MMASSEPEEPAAPATPAVQVVVVCGGRQATRQEVRGILSSPRLQGRSPRAVLLASYDDCLKATFHAAVVACGEALALRNETTAYQVAHVILGCSRGFLMRLGEVFEKNGMALHPFCASASPKRGLGFRPALRWPGLQPGERLYHLLAAGRHTAWERWETTYECEELLTRLELLARTGALLKPASDLVATHHVQAIVAQTTGLRCETFGSQVTGAVTDSSDVDFTLLDTGETYRDRTACISVLDVAATALEYHGYAVERRWTARIPLLRLQTWEGTVIDLTAFNHLGQCNSLLLAEYARISPRFLRLTIAAKDWMRRRGFLGAFEGGLSSYAVSVMTLFYSMTRGSDCMPNLQELAPGEPARWLCDSGGQPWRVNFRASRPEERCEDDPTEDAAALLRGYFKFYTAFDWTREVVQPALLRRGTPFDRAAALALARAATVEGWSKAIQANQYAASYCVLCPLEPSQNIIRYAYKFELVLQAMRLELCDDVGVPSSR